MRAYTVRTPVAKFTGVIVGVSFADGVAKGVTSTKALDYFRRHGYPLTPEDGTGAATPAITGDEGLVVTPGATGDPVNPNDDPNRGPVLTDPAAAQVSGSAELATTDAAAAETAATAKKPAKATAPKQAGPPPAGEESDR